MGRGVWGGPSDSYSTTKQPTRTMTMAQKAVTVGDVIVFVRLVFLKQTKTQTQHDGKNRTTRLTTAT